MPKTSFKSTDLLNEVVTVPTSSAPTQLYRICAVWLGQDDRVAVVLRRCNGFGRFNGGAPTTVHLDSVEFE